MHLRPWTARKKHHGGGSLYGSTLLYESLKRGARGRRGIALVLLKIVEV